MANVKFSQPYDMSVTFIGYSVFDSRVTQQTSSQIVVDLGNVRDTYQGRNFTYSGDLNRNGRVTGGNLTRISSTFDGLGRVADIKFTDPTSAAKVYNFINQDDGQGLFRYIYKNNDRIVGSSGNDTLLGYSGKDVLVGGNGDDVLAGDVGNDKLLGKAGNDTANGGKGNDTIKGSGGNDIINGDQGNDTIKGGGSDDTIDGGKGKDTINGGGGNDTIDGGKRKDTIKGGGGNDEIRGGGGVDVVRGGGGADTYVLQQGAGHLNVFDFQDGVDKLGRTIGANITTQSVSSGTQVFQNGDLVALLQGINPDQITDADFSFL